MNYALKLFGHAAARSLPLALIVSIWVLAIIMPLGLAGGALLFMSASNETAAAVGRAQRRAELLTAAVERELKGHIVAAEVLASSGPLTGGPRTGGPLSSGPLSSGPLSSGLDEAAHRLADDVRKRVGGHFVLINRDLQQVLNTRVGFGTPLPRAAHAPEVQAVFESGRPVVGDLRPGALSKQELFVVRVPVWKDGRVAYVLSYTPGPRAIVEALQQSPGPPGWTAAVLDGTGRVVAHSERNEALQGHAASAALIDIVNRGDTPVEAIGLEGVRGLMLAEPVANSNWHLLVEVPKSALEVPLLSAMRKAAVLGALALAISLVAAWFGTRTLMRPVEQLAGAAAAMAETRPIALAPTGIREFDQIAHAVASGSMAISDRQLATIAHLNELRDRDQRLDLALDAAHAEAFEWELDVSPSAPAEDVLAALSRANPSFSHLHVAIHPADVAAFEAKLVHTLRESGAHRYQQEYRIVNQSGGVSWRREWACVTDIGTAGRKRIIGIAVDETERRQSAEELSRSKALLDTLFDSAPLGLALIDRDGRFMRVNRWLAEINGMTPDEHVGRTPDDLGLEIEDKQRIYALWEEVWRTGQPQLNIAVAGKSRTQPGRMRSFNESFYPVHVDGEIIALGALVEETTEREATQHALKESQSRFQAIFEMAPVPMTLRAMPSGRFVDVNRAFLEARSCSRAEVIGKTGQELGLYPGDSLVVTKLAELERMDAPETFETVIKTRSGTSTVIMSLARVQLDGRPHALATTFDITERKRSEEHIRVLLGEVNHRSKNILSLVQAVARQTVAASPADFLNQFESRVRAISLSQDLLVKNEWKGAPLQDIIEQQLGHFREIMGSRVRIGGPSILVLAAPAQVVGMAIHELATNSAKYGALSNAIGTVDLTWSIGEPGRLTMNWIEHGGPPVEQPTRRGFGSKVIGSVIQSSLSAEVESRFDADGFKWSMSCDLAAVGRHGRTRAGAGPAAAPPIGGGSAVLIVEDEVLVGLELADMLRERGFDIVGPARTVAEATALIRGWRCDVAILDVNLGTETSAPVARVLADAGTPFVLVSGYARDQLPPELQGYPLLSKPLEWGRLRSEIDRLFENARAVQRTT